MDSHFISPWAHIKRPITAPKTRAATPILNEKSTQRPSTAKRKVIESKVTVSKLMLKTVETVKSLSYLDAQPTLLVGSLEDRTVMGDQCSFNQSQTIRSRVFEGDSYANVSFDSARPSTRAPREMLTMINSRVRHNRDPPSFVSQFHDLPPSSLSWDERPTLKRMEASNPPVNVIGCNHSLDLILAKADWRARQIQKVNEIRAEKAEQRVKDLQEEIVFKQGRAARHAAAMELQQKQIAWMKFVSLLRFIENAKEQYESKKTIILKMQRNSRQLMIIRKIILQWYRYRIYQKYTRNLQFRGVMNLNMLVRIRRKIHATNVIKQFLYESRHSGRRVLCVVQRFNTAVHQVQRLVRSFLIGRRAQLLAVEQLWLSLEMSHLCKLMEKQKKTQTRVPPINLNLLDLRSKETMTRQASKWSRFDAKMTAVVDRLRFRKILHHRTEEEELQRQLLPASLRRQHLERIVSFLRNDFYKRNRAMMLLQKEKEKRGFNELDALDMLCGRNVDRIYSTISGISMDELAEKHGGPNVFSAAVAKNSSSSSSSSSEIVTSHARTAKSNALARRVTKKSSHVPFRLFRTFSQPEQRVKIMNLIKELHEKQRAVDPFEFEQ